MEVSRLLAPFGRLGITDGPKPGLIASEANVTVTGRRVETRRDAEIGVSRRSFLTGALAATAAAALPTPNPVEWITNRIAETWRAEIVGMDFGALEARTLYWYLYPAQWKFFEAEGFDMRRCKRIELCPTINDPTSHVPASFAAATRPAPKPSKPETSQTALRNALIRVQRQRHDAAKQRQTIGSRHGGAARIPKSLGRRDYA